MIRVRSVHTPHTASLILLVVAVCLATCSSHAQETPTVEKIWDQARHSAFTDLIRWQDRFYCTFREGERHVFGADGQVRIITSDDGKHWKSVALLAEKGVDLRDPKLSITPDDRLMILMGGSYYKGHKLLRRLSRVSFLKPGEAEPTNPVPVKLDSSVASGNDWVWRVTWHKGVGYGNLYQAFYPPGTKPDFPNADNRPWGFYLVKTIDGIHYEPVATFDLGMANEATSIFLDDDRMLTIVRNVDVADLGISSPPYTDWKWKRLPRQLGGPDLIHLPNGTIVLGTRVLEGPQGSIRHTIFGTLALDGTFTECIRLPSGNDTSYPGMLIYNDMLWASYYSSHEGRASIYLAKIPLTYFQRD
ncbi:MAG: hypothetical protein WD468_09825 [Pirellulales bacterium]